MYFADTNDTCMLAERVHASGSSLSSWNISQLIILKIKQFQTRDGQLKLIFAFRTTGFLDFIHRPIF
jgi:hypothetical protein